ncbi:MAG: hypothetical protein ACRD16_05935 [Thermoanaerobaculia bacterium]
MKSEFRFSRRVFGKRLPGIARTLMMPLAGILWIIAAGPALASDVPVDLGAFVNFDLTTASGGANYPQNGGPLTVAGIPFTLTVGSNGKTAIVLPSETSGDMQTFSIPVGVSGVTSVYTLINSAFGACSTPIGELDFVGASSTTFVFNLTEGVNARDHFNDGYCNTVTDVAGTANFGPDDRLDMQQIDLPATFVSDTLVRIDFKSYGAGHAGVPFLAAATTVSGAVEAVQTVPTLNPGMLAGFACLLAVAGIVACRKVC